MKLLHFLIAQSRLLRSFGAELNERQEKVLMKLFAAGPEGFSSGLSAEKYLSITKASRATLTRDLAALVAKGILKKTGERRHVRYWLCLDSLGEVR